MTRSTTTLFCLLGALALAPAASAQHHDMSKHHEAGHDMPRHGGMAMMDADGDGAVTPPNTRPSRRRCSPRRMPMRMAA